jgi:hypothetical protein
MKTKLRNLAMIFLLFIVSTAFTLSPKLLIKNEEANDDKQVEVLGIVEHAEILKSSSGAYEYILIELSDGVTVVAFKEKIPKHTKIFSQDLVKVKGTFSLSKYFAGREFKRVIITDTLEKITTS